MGSYYSLGVNKVYKRKNEGLLVLSLLYRALSAGCGCWPAGGERLPGGEGRGRADDRLAD